MFETKDVEIGGATYSLKPTLKAMRAVNQHFGSMEMAYSKLAAIDFSAVVAVIAAGAELQGKATERLEQSVFEAGVSNCAPIAIEFLALLMNPTGRDDDEEIDEGN